MARTASEWVEVYQSAINRLVTGGAASVSVDGQSFSMLSLSQLEDGLRYWEARAYEEDPTAGGFVTQADMSTVGL